MSGTKELIALANKVESSVARAYGGGDGPDIYGYVFPALEKAYKLGREDALKEQEAKKT